MISNLSGKENKIVIEKLQNEETRKQQCLSKKREIIEHVNDDELALCSSSAVLEINERGEQFTKL